MQSGNKENPFLAVWMVTYNHEKYVAQAIESVMMQQTNFAYKLFIGEDCSTDQTREICQALQKKYPDRIELFLNEQNLGGSKNAKQIYEACFSSGASYIAMLEADDYWTDPHKLQKQVDFLENHRDYALCFHKIEILKTNGEIVPDFITKVPEQYETRESLARFGNYIHTPSVVFRNVIAQLPPEFYQSPIGDFFLYIILSGFGKLKYLPETMAVYRHGVGFFSEQKGMGVSLHTIRFYSCLLSYLEDGQIKKIIFDRQTMAFDAYNANAAYKFSSNAYLAKQKTFLDILKITAGKFFRKK